jgi:hypothetical protein
MRAQSSLSNERGVALILTLFLAIIVASMAIGIIMMTSNATLISRFHAKEAEMEASADAGLEWARDQLNSNAVTLPALGYATLESNATVLDASGNPISGYTRSTYAGRSGILSGQFGVFASVISIISDTRGAVVVRRSQLSQDSFAKYAEFTNVFPACCCVGYGSIKFGPVHSNTNYVLCGTGPAVFNGPVTVVTTITNQAVGTFNSTVKTGAAPIPMPNAVQLAAVQGIAATSNTVVAGDAVNTADPDTRVEFVAIDLDADGDVTDADEGFIRVFKSVPPSTAVTRQYVNGRTWTILPVGQTYVGIPGPSAPTPATDPNLFSPNCGGTINRPGLGVHWFRADTLMTIFGNTTAGRDSVRVALGGPNRRCYLGGDSAITSTPAGIWNPALPTPYGSWVPWPFAPAAKVTAAVGGKGQFLWPISRNLNNPFQGVIYVNGSVGTSGLVRGQALLAVSGQIMLDDDLTYVTAPNTTCADVLGYTSPAGIRIADNTLNSPFRVNNAYVNNFDGASGDETFHGVFMALTVFDGENPGSGANSGTPAAGRENCPVGNAWGRGCDTVIGGLIQNTGGATGSGSGAGWNDQYSYDTCSLRNPPPYFPTTGRYAKYQYFEIDPVGFNVATWYANNQ